MVLIISKTSSNIFSGYLPRWILHEAVFVDDAAYGKLCGKEAAPAGAFPRACGPGDAFPWASGLVVVAGLLEAPLPGRARQQACGSSSLDGD